MILWSGTNFTNLTSLYYYRARYYDPNIGRFISEDPIRFAGSSVFYVYTLNRPIIAKDPSGLKILICSRPAENGVGNHAFLYSTLNGDNCGKGPGNHPHGHESPTAPGTVCTEVPGSDGQEPAVMKCCQTKANSFWGRFTWFPWLDDCHNLAENCLTENGLKSPGAPGGRISCRGNCKPLNLEQPIVVPRVP